MVPPPRFAAVRFETYRPDPAEPTQAAAVAAVRAFSGRTGDGSDGRRGWLRRRAAPPEDRPGLYLDGGFGVGKTHLLASLWHAVAGRRVRKGLRHVRRAARTWSARSGSRRPSRQLSAITGWSASTSSSSTTRATRVLVATLLGRARRRGRRARRHLEHAARQARRGPVRCAGLPARDPGAFRPLRCRPDRRRGLPPPRLPDAPTAGRRAGRRPRAPSGRDARRLRRALLEHLAPVHPSRYGALLDGVSRVALLGVRSHRATRRSRCAWSCSPTGSTTGTCRSSPAACPWTSCSRRTC